MGIDKPGEDQVPLQVYLPVPLLPIGLLGAHVSDFPPFYPDFPLGHFPAAIHRQDFSLIKPNVHLLPLSFIINFPQRLWSAVIPGEKHKQKQRDHIR